MAQPKEEVDFFPAHVILLLHLEMVFVKLHSHLADCVTKQISDADRKKIAQLEQADVYLRLENTKLKVGTSCRTAPAALQVSVSDNKITI